jgi:hypothetical protein
VRALSAVSQSPLEDRSPTKHSYGSMQKKETAQIDEFDVKHL